MKSLNLKNLRNKPSFNGFDRSHRNLFTAKVGELLPVCVVEMSPGDKIDYHPQGFTRTQPLETSAFTRIEEHYDSFFVPYRLLWRFANDTFTMTNNAFAASSMSSAYRANTDFPHISLGNLQADIDIFAPMADSEGKDYNPTFVNRFGYNRGPLMCKLANLLGYGYAPGQHFGAENTSVDSSKNWESLSIGNNQNIAVTPFRFLAYQKIWSDWYRNDNWQSVRPWQYNIDYITPDSAKIARSTFIDDTNKNNGTIYDLQYVNYKLDYFLGGLPNSQLGEVAGINLNINTASGLTINNPTVTAHSSTSGNLFLTASSATPNNKKNILLSNSDSAQSYVDSISGSVTLNSSSITALSIRQAMFLQKWREIAQSGNKDYKTQVEKHFGKDVSNVLANKCTFIDGTSGNIVINDVVNTTLSGSDEAVIKGKGVGSTDGRTHFEAEEHGIFMTVYYARPLLDWSNSGVDAFNLKTSAEDFAIPELDSIGMQKLPYVQFNSNSQDAGLDTFQYVPRYFEYKSAFDRVNGEFLNTLRSWVSLWSPNDSDSPDEEPLVGDLLPVNPSIMDSIFGVNANSSTDTDQLLVGLFNEVHLTTCLDLNGLPY